ncbi:hypothetical protein NN561_013899 [Cricetulus griseus]
MEAADSVNATGLHRLNRAVSALSDASLLGDKSGHSAALWRTTATQRQASASQERQQRGPEMEPTEPPTLRTACFIFIFLNLRWAREGAETGGAPLLSKVNLEMWVPSAAGGGGGGWGA